MENPVPRKRNGFLPKTTTMSLLARAPRLAARSARSNMLVQSRGMHGEYKHIPFDYDKKVPLAIKTFLFLGTGFSIPFVASYYQLSKK